MTNILTIEELKNSVLNANVDNEYIQPAIDEAQSIYLREILGDALLNAVVNRINSNNLTGKYLTLVNEYIKPYLTYMVQSLIVVPITYKIRNAGVIQQYDNGFTSTQVKDTQYLKDYYDGKAEFYGNRLTEYLKKNADSFTEYRINAVNVTQPTTSQNVTNIFLGGTKRGKCGGVKSSGASGGVVDWDDIINRPNFAAVATSGDYDDLNDRPTIPTVNDATLTIKQGGTTKGTFTANADQDVVIDLDAGGGGGGGSTDWDDITNKPNFATVATSGSYNDLSNTPNLATVATSGSYNDLSNTPSLATVATSGSYNDLTNKPTIPAAQVNSDWNASSGVQQILNKPTLATVATTGAYSDLSGTPNLATVATSGSYNDLTNKPTIPAAQINADWNASSGVSQILNKPNLATVATSGSYSDLSGTPNLATVATSGSYTDLSNTPTIPAAPVQSDWNESNTSSLAYIQNKPTIPDDETDIGLTTETWTFALLDDTVITRQVVIKR